MTRTMYDGVTADRLPVDAQIIAGYVDGLYAWSDAGWARFPHATKVRIAVFATTNDGDVLDCEPGNCTPAESVDWVLLRRKAGKDPTVYCNQMNPTTGWPAVRAAFKTRNVPEPHYWVADYDGVAELPVGAIAKQLQDDEKDGWDVSVVADYWPGVDPAPVPVPASNDTVTTTTRRRHVHIDLKPNDPVVFTNPAATLGGTATLLLASDFGDATVRLGIFSFKAASWTVETIKIMRTGGAFSMSMPADVNKVSVINQTAGVPVGLDVLL